VIEIRTTKKYGRGLYANKDIKAGELIESSPIIILEQEDTAGKYLEQEDTAGKYLELYVYIWKGNKECLALGFGSLFNHKEKSNIDYSCNYKDKCMEYWANSNIRKGSQLFIDYGYDPKVAIKDLTYRIRKAYEKTNC